MTEEFITVIRQKIAEYVDGIISLEQFSDWFYSSLKVFEESQDETVIGYHSLIDNELTEFNFGQWTEDEVKEHLVRNEDGEE